MKIAMILDEEYPYDPRVQNEALSLLENGCSVHLLCFDYKGLPASEIIHGMKVTRIKTTKLHRKFSALAYTLPVYKWMLRGKIRKFLLEGNFDAVHVHDMAIGNIVLKASKNLFLSRILDLHENRPEIMKYYEHVKSFPGKILIYPSVWKRWEKRLVRRYDKVVVVTPEARQAICSAYKIPEGKIIVFPNTVSPSFYAEYDVNENIIERFSKDYVLLYIGNTGARRGLETAVKALKRLRKPIPNCKLVILGKSTNDANLKKLAAGLQVEERISFEGFLPMELFHSYILASDVCISPLTRNLHHDTTLANKIFQYMSMGVPVLVSDSTAQKNIVQIAEAGLIHKAEDADDFASQILKFYHDPDFAKQCGNNGVSFIKNHFNQDITCKELISYYNNLNANNHV
jgi:glycosyltransferase involved in cell wall biosynthesis